MVMVVLSLQCVLVGMSILGKDDCEMISDGVLVYCFLLCGFQPGFYQCS